MIIIPIEISARHVHLNRQDLDILFGSNYELTFKKAISQTGQYAASETVILRNDDKEIIKVRVVGPLRKNTQVELSVSDARRLGIDPPVEKSGNMADAEILTIIGPKGTVTKKCAIIPQRHIHASVEDAEKYNLHDGQIVSIKCGREREIIFSNVIVRIDKNFVWNLHLDTDEASAAGLTIGASGIVIIV